MSGVCFEEAARKITGGAKTVAVAPAMRRLRRPAPAACSDAHPGSVRIAEGADLTAPIRDVISDAESWRQGFFTHA